MLVSLQASFGIAEMGILQLDPSYGGVLGNSDISCLMTPTNSNPESGSYTGKLLAEVAPIGINPTVGYSS